ncbi:hypothetical protein BDV35DRAFT_292489 [Aspergillus flavus]|uniref:Uncharacterized protein n=1 Tax=Aspergillus flavus TaxID=5059 RepID=A0A5N6GT97_ASPFL|nr:hypothetical protein BDV35DRAFT_292489 [Aspergillus flavus]
MSHFFYFSPDGQPNYEEGDLSSPSDKQDFSPRRPGDAHVPCLIRMDQETGRPMDNLIYSRKSLVTRGMVSASRVYSFNLSQANHFVSRREWGIGWRDGVLVQYVYRFQYVRGSSLDLAQCRHRFKPYCCNTLSLSTRSFNRSGCHGFITATFAIASFFAEICTGYLEFLMTKSHQGERERNDLCIRTLYSTIKISLPGLRM